MRRKLLAISLSMILVCQSVCIFGKTTGEINGHNLPVNVDVYGPTKELKSSESTALGENCDIKYVKITDNYISAAFSKNSSRILYLDLYEYDKAPNEDDKVLAYRGSFNGRYLKNVYFYTRYITDNIDSKGDPTAELYVKGSMTKMTGDPKSTYASKMFYKYKIELK